MDSFISWFKPKSSLKTVHRNTAKKSKAKRTIEEEKQKKIDAILDKISKSGYDSLSAKEKTFLFDASKED